MRNLNVFVLKWKVYTQTVRKIDRQLHITKHDQWASLLGHIVFVHGNIESRQTHPLILLSQEIISTDVFALVITAHELAQHGAEYCMGP